jgi:SNF2 family DNA or RNA helicase
MAFKPMKHQLEAQIEMKKMESEGRGGFLCDDMGLGKSACMAMYMKTNKIKGKTDLIVCPTSIMSTWKNEILQVKDWPEAGTKPRILIYHGPASTRQNALESSKRSWDYVITSYGVMGSGELKYRRWGRIVLDESHSIKNGFNSPPPNRAKAAFDLTDKSVFNWCVSGTPYNNKVSDIAAQCHFIGTYPYSEKTWWKENREDKEALTKWREKFVVRRTKEGILPEPTYIKITIDPTDRELKIVNTLRAKASKQYIRWKRAQGLEKLKIQGHLLALIVRLRIYSNSFYCQETPIVPEDVLRDNAKVSQLIDDIDEQVFKDSKQGVVVFSQFVSFLDVLGKVIEYAMAGVEVLKFTGSMTPDERDRVVTRFNTCRHPRVILVSLMAGGTGLSLHHGSSSLMLCEPYFNPFCERQAIDRVNRIGQTEEVVVRQYNVLNSVETWIDKLKQRKLMIGAGLDLGNSEDLEIASTFVDDIRDLFRDHVSFTTDEGIPLETQMEKDKNVFAPIKEEKVEKVEKVKRKKGEKGGKRGDN